MRIALLAFACLLACSPKMLPGTQIPDNPANREVLDTFSRYRDRLEALDASGLIGMAAPTYYDAGDPGRSIGPTDYVALQQKIKTDFSRVKGIKLEATIRDIEVKGDEARLDFFQVLHYAIATPTGEKWKSESDDARMMFARVNGEWKIASGL